MRDPYRLIEGKKKRKKETAIQINRAIRAICKDSAARYARADIALHICAPFFSSFRLLFLSIESSINSGVIASA